MGYPSPTPVTADDLPHLRRCVDLAREALDDGDEPFGSLLVDAGGTVLFEDRNRVRGGDQTRHPELEIARWAAEHLSPEERRGATAYTSGEHCPMCSAAHAWVGLGPIVYASSSEQLVAWRQEWGFPPGPVNPLPINAVAPDVSVAGPDPQLAAEIRLLHARMWGVADG
jgi:tRNA(Arg) A34 adenosine deaminase TadA